MKNLLTILFFLLGSFVLGQDTTFFDKDWNRVSSFKIANYYQIVVHDQKDTNRVVEKVYFKSGQQKMQKNYSVYKEKKLDGKYMVWYENGQVRKDIDYKDGKKNGQLLTYWENGKPKRIDSFENDKWVKGYCFNPDGMEALHYDYIKMAEFPGGINELMQFLVKETKYPSKSKKKETEGLVLVRFIVNKDGSISDVKVVQSVNDELDQEALRVVAKMPKWEPGMEDGEAVRATFSLPINFKLK